MLMGINQVSITAPPESKPAPTLLHSSGTNLMSIAQQLMHMESPKSVFVSKVFSMLTQLRLPVVYWPFYFVVHFNFQFGLSIMSRSADQWSQSIAATSSILNNIKKGKEEEEKLAPRQKLDGFIRTENLIKGFNSTRRFDLTFISHRLPATGVLQSQRIHP